MKKRWIAVIAGAAVVVAGVTIYAVREQRISAAECELVHTLADETAAPIGDGTPVTVVGDSYSQGFGLDDPRTSWISYVPDLQATVSASSGAGFTREGLCGAPSVSDLAAAASGPVILQGGLNDVGGDLTSLADAVDTVLEEGDVIAVIGPANAPAFDPAGIAEVAEVLRAAAEAHDVPFIDATGWDLPFSDGIHLTPHGHEVFAEHVAAEL